MKKDSLATGGASVMGTKKHTIPRTALLYVCLLLCFLSGGCGKAKEPAAEGGAEASGLVVGFPSWAAKAPGGSAIPPVWKKPPQNTASAWS